MRVPKKTEDFERAMLYAFKCGLNAGYGINHENIHEEEKKAAIEFCVQNHFVYYGKINELQI